MTVDDLYKKYNHMYDDPKYQKQVDIGRVMLAYDIARERVIPDDSIGDDLRMLIDFFYCREVI